MPKLMLIDGNSLVNRAYYGVRPLSAPDVTPTNAVFGFLNILQKLLDDEATSTARRIRRRASPCRTISPRRCRF